MRRDIENSVILASLCTAGWLGRSWEGHSGAERSSTTRTETSSIIDRAIYMFARAKPSMNTFIASTAISIRKKISENYHFSNDCRSGEEGKLRDSRNDSDDMECTPAVAKLGSIVR